MDFFYTLPGHRWPAAEAWLSANLRIGSWTRLADHDPVDGLVSLSFRDIADRQNLHDHLDGAIRRQAATDPAAPLRAPVSQSRELKLNIGGTIPSPGWSIYDSRQGPGVNYIGEADDLSIFADGSVCEIYCCHALMRLSHNGAVTRALNEFFRVLKPGGRLRLSVPDLEALFRQYLKPETTEASRRQLLATIFGSQAVPAELHRTGFDFGILSKQLEAARFERITRLDSLGLFADASERRIDGTPISLNVEAWKPVGTAAR